MNVTVVWATHEAQDVVPVAVDAGATIADAVALSGVALRYRIDVAQLGFAVFGRQVAPDTRVADGDRIELTRPLAVDPKEARRLRAGSNDRDLASPAGGRSQSG
jgi:putative ubiquitin-RnfH superfamily antitoxin RatB of RatAB toxin-antitoxin module